MLAPALALIVVLRLIPLVFNVALSLSDANLARPQDPVSFVGFDNYRALFAGTSDFPASKPFKACQRCSSTSRGFAVIPGACDIRMPRTMLNAILAILRSGRLPID